MKKKFNLSLLLINFLRFGSHINRIHRTSSPPPPQVEELSLWRRPSPPKKCFFTLDTITVQYSRYHILIRFSHVKLKLKLFGFRFIYWNFEFNISILLIIKFLENYSKFIHNFPDWSQHCVSLIFLNFDNYT